MDRLPDAPTFYPTAEEFADPVQYIRKLQPRVAAEHGTFLCLRVPQYASPLVCVQVSARLCRQLHQCYQQPWCVCCLDAAQLHIITVLCQVLNNSNGDGKRFTFATRQQPLRCPPCEELAPRRSFETNKYVRELMLAQHSPANTTMTVFTTFSPPPGGTAWRCTSALRRTLHESAWVPQACCLCA